MSKQPIVIADNAYGSSVETSQRGPRARHGTKGERRGYRPPRVGSKRSGKRK